MWYRTVHVEHPDTAFGGRFMESRAIHVSENNKSWSAFEQFMIQLVLTTWFALGKGVGHLVCRGKGVGPLVYRMKGVGHLVLQGEGSWSPCFTG